MTEHETAIRALEYRVHASNQWAVKEYHREAAVAEWTALLQLRLREWPTWPDGEPKKLVADIRDVVDGEALLVPAWR